jgi:hypothetical protein
MTTGARFTFPGLVPLLFSTSLLAQSPRMPRPQLAATVGSGGLSWLCSLCSTISKTDDFTLTARVGVQMHKQLSVGAVATHFRSTGQQFTTLTASLQVHLLRQHVHVALGAGRAYFQESVSYLQGGTSGGSGHVTHAGWGVDAQLSYSLPLTLGVALTPQVGISRSLGSLHPGVGGIDYRLVHYGIGLSWTPQS